MPQDRFKKTGLTSEWRGWKRLEERQRGSGFGSKSRLGDHCPDPRLYAGINLDEEKKNNVLIVANL